MSEENKTIRHPFRRSSKVELRHESSTIVLWIR